MHRRSLMTTISLYIVLIIGLSIHLSLLIGTKNNTAVLMAFLILGCHAIVNFYCAVISSYRFKNPTTRYIEIKNKVIKKLLVRTIPMGDACSIGKGDNRINIIGLILHIINTLLFISFEIFLILPPIPCEPYALGFSAGRRFHRHHYSIELNTLNEIIPAQVSRIFVIAMFLIFIVFLILFEHQPNEHRRKIKRTRKNKQPHPERLKKTKWHYPLYKALIDISARRNNKKRKYWYKTAQLKEIEVLVSVADKCAELKLNEKNDKLVSFTIIDTLNDYVVFEGLFI